MSMSTLGVQFAGYLVARRLYSHSYVVQFGDTVESIAGKFGVEVGDIVELNRLHTPYRVHPGQLLRMPVAVR